MRLAYRVTLWLNASLLVSLTAVAEETQTVNGAESLLTAPIVVTATRTEQNSFDLPVAIDLVTSKDIKDGQLQNTLSESLIRVPGITAQNRTQQAQDPQLSSRGFGARSTFGVRGVRLYVDGIPLTMPDGQGQPGVVDLSAIKSTEVMRGPFSALYGNSSGGVIQMLAENPSKDFTLGGTAMFGSYQTRREVLTGSGTAGNVGYYLNLSRFETDGYRDHSASEKDAATAKFSVDLGADTKLTALAHWLNQTADDPLGLNRARAFSTPTAVVPAVNFANTRVSRNHRQLGFNLTHNFNENNSITITPYVGTRRNAQVLTTTATATTLATTNARLSEIDRDFYGTDMRWDHQGKLVNLPYTLSAGLTYGRMEDARSDTNVLANGAPVSVANRNEDNIARNFDQYLQGKLSLRDNLDWHAGVRRTTVNLAVRDKLLTVNGDNSGDVEYQKTTPVTGVVWKALPHLNLYANYGKGFETPTFVEAAFDNVTAGVASKPNLGLKAAESRNYEVGAKAFLGNNIQANLTLFKIDTENEIVTRQTVAGRSSFQNAGRTERTGAEASIDARFDNNLSLFAAYTLLNATFEDAFTTVTNAAGATGTVNAGNRIPGTYKSQIYGEVAWRYQPLGFNIALEGRYNDSVFVNDINTDSAPSYTIFNLRAGFKQKLNHWSLSEYIRVENIGDRDYIGSVRINDGNALFFEPGAGRNYLLGINAAYQF